MEHLRGSAEEAANLRDQTAELKRSLAEKREGLAKLKKENQVQSETVHRELCISQNEVQRLRHKNKSLHEISDHLHQEKQTLADAVKASLLLGFYEHTAKVL